MKNEKVFDLYENNKDFKEYVNKHCKMYNKTVEQSLNERIVLLYAENITQNIDKQDWVLGK